MWFVIGMVVGIFLTCFIVWLDKKFFIIDDLLFNMRLSKNLESIEDPFDDGFIFCGDKPHGKPIPFKDWEKKFVGKNGK